eukprot:scaffold41099_cov79-Cyclotella_meneghiniana.AAC.1
MCRRLMCGGGGGTSGKEFGGHGSVGVDTLPLRLFNPGRREPLSLVAPGCNSVGFIFLAYEDSRSVVKVSSAPGLVFGAMLSNSCLCEQVHRMMCHVLLLDTTATFRPTTNLQHEN